LSKNNFLNRLSGVQKLLEVGIIGCAFAAIFISISLLTFSPVDPSWSQQQWVSEIQNAGGMVGSWIADILFYGFGLLAYFIPVLIAVFAWFFLWKPKFSFDMDFLNLGLRIIGFISNKFYPVNLACFRHNLFTRFFLA
jgi:S-DNA-T family DNA segregation ATPase FtsK/SpoIIIE